MIFSLAYSDLPALNAGFVPNLLAPNLFRNPLVPCNDFLPPCTKGCKIDLKFSRENMDEKIKCETILGYIQFWLQYNLVSDAKGTTTSK